MCFGGSPDVSQETLPMSLGLLVRLVCEPEDGGDMFL
jgi:hypothetical protein